MRGQGFKYEPIIWYDEFEKDGIRTESVFKKWLIEKGGRREELGYILDALGDLGNINRMLKCDMSNNSNSPLSGTSVLGIIDGRENSNNARNDQIIIMFLNIFLDILKRKNYGII